MPVPPPPARPGRPGRPAATVPVPLTAVAAWTGAAVHPPGAGSLPVTGVSLSSQRVHPGDLYAALPGARVHGATFVPDAVSAGAVAVLTDHEGAAMLRGRPDVPVLVVDAPRAVLGDLAARVYAEPARALTLVAVTGTQGKTTTTRLLDGALAASGVPSAVIGTVGTRVRGRDVASALTTPEAPDLHALFAVMVQEGVRACAMEVSSHALVMGRVDGVRFDAAGFLNLGHDHLDFHRDEEDYFAAKASLFTPERAARGVVNVDDPWGRRLLATARVPMVTCAVTGPDAGQADWRALDVRHDADGSTFTVVTPDGRRLETRVPLSGTFNVTNALCAVALAGEAGLDAAAVAAGMAAAGGVPGRMEQVDAGQDFVAVVDYAHKPDALTAVLQALRPATTGRLLVVLGAGGDRDTAKRPVMGRIAAELADVVVVTDDNPRSEDPAAIRAEVLRGAREAAGGAEVREVGDRGEAIRSAVALARAGDTLVVAGKGHETGQTVGSTTHPFDDRVVLRAALEEAR